MTAADFKAAFPAFTNETDAVVNAQIAASGPFLNVAAWGDLYNAGLGYWVAHKIVIGKTDGATLNANDIINRKDGAGGDVSRGPDLLKEQQANPYLRSTYGQEFWRLLRLVGKRVGGVVA